MSKDFATGFVGLLVVVLSFTSIGLYYYLLFNMLQLINASPFMWTIYWWYAPIGVITGLLASALKALVK